MKTNELKYYIGLYGNFSPKQFEIDNNFKFSKTSEIGDLICNGKYKASGASAEIHPNKDEYIIDFVKRIKKLQKTIFNKENLAKYNLDLILFDIKINRHSNIHFDPYQLNQISQLKFVNDIVIHCIKRCSDWS